MSDSKNTSTSKETAHTVDVERHVRWLAPASIVVLLAATVFLWMRREQESERFQEFQAYLDASSPAEPLSAREQADRLATVVEAYPKSPEAPMALIQAGALLFNEGDYEGALTQYQAFLAAYPQHPLNNNAQWAALHCQESLDQLETALAGYQAYTPADLLYPQAQLAMARIHEKQNDWTKAKAVYQRILDEMPDSPYAGQAELFLQHPRMQNQDA
jgi:tetratricopeptide (TPR) repeat protein